MYICIYIHLPGVILQKKKERRITNVMFVSNVLKTANLFSSLFSGVRFGYSSYLLVPLKISQWSQVAFGEKKKKRQAYN